VDGIRALFGMGKWRIVFVMEINGAMKSQPGAEG
jgi:hypothetical protein